MPNKRINIAGKPYYSIDSISKGESVSDAVYDGYFDESNTLHRRSGLYLYVDFNVTSEGQGLYYWTQQDVLISVIGGQIYTINDAGNIVNITGSVIINPLSKISFAAGNKLDGTPWLYIFDGNVPIYTTGGNCARIDTSRGCPDHVSFGCWHTGRFLLLEDSTRNFVASVTDPGSGNIEPDYFIDATNNPLVAEQMPDNVDGLYSMYGEIYAWGTNGCELWRNDEVFFAPIQGAFINAGLAAPRSVTQADNTVYALCTVDGTGKRAVVKLAGRSPQVLSLPIESVLNSYSDVSDAIGVLTADSQYILSIPSQNITWVYDIKADKWYKWSSRDLTNAVRNIFECVYFASAWGKDFGISRLDGKLFELKKEVYTDNGNQIVTELITGWIDHETSLHKRSNKLRIMVKRGTVDNGIIMLKWRDNGELEWIEERQLDLGNIGQRFAYIDTDRLGQYISRQYSIAMSSNSPMVLVSIEETLDGLTK